MDLDVPVPAALRGCVLGHRGVRRDVGDPEGNRWSFGTYRPGG